MARIDRAEEIAKFYNLTTNVYDSVTIRLRFDYVGLKLSEEIGKQRSAEFHE